MSLTDTLASFPCGQVTEIRGGIAQVTEQAAGPQHVPWARVELSGFPGLPLEIGPRLYGIYWRKVTPGQAGTFTGRLDLRKPAKPAVVVTGVIWRDPVTPACR